MKAKGKKIVADDEPAESGGKSNVIDLMAALKKSLEKPGAASADKAPAKSAPAQKKAPARKKAA